MKDIQSIIGRTLVLTTALLVIANTSRADAGGYAVTASGLDWNVLQKITVEHGKRFLKMAGHTIAASHNIR